MSSFYYDVYHKQIGDGARHNRPVGMMAPANIVLYSQEPFSFGGQRK